MSKGAQRTRIRLKDLCAGTSGEVAQHRDTPLGIRPAASRLLVSRAARFQRARVASETFGTLRTRPTLRFVGSSLVISLFLAVANTGQGQSYKHPVYVGVQECARCHAGKQMGYQHCLWLISKHARAYTALARPEARQIARLSGIPQDPQQSPTCLGCHATASDTEDWEKDETFHIEDGVQCERCHGPGSEYMDESVMTDREAARAAGLRMPTRADCMKCHAAKGSHVAVLNSPTFDIEKAWTEIQHPTPTDWDYPPDPPPLRPVDKTQPRYIGSLACGACHRGLEYGYQHSRWLASAHAKAYAVLGTDEAQRRAREMGVSENPLTSTACLKCHTTAYGDAAAGAASSYAVSEGVGCEACHGPGSDHAPEPMMRDPKAVARTGLKPVTAATCLNCHRDAHGKPFDQDAAWKAIAHPTQRPQEAEAIRYKTPLNMALHPNGRELYVTCEASDSLIVVDTARRKKVAEIAVGGQPTNVTFQPDGKWAYVSNRLDDSVSVISVPARKVVQTVPVGDEPHGLLTDRAGQFLYVLNTSSNDISVVDTTTLQEAKRLEASRAPWSLALSPDSSQILVTNALTRFVPPRTPAVSEITVIDTKRAVVENRRVVQAANLLLGVDWHPSGDFALVTLNRTKNLVPMTRLLQGWTITNGLGIVWRDGRVDQVLLDEPNVCFPDPTDVAFTPDGRLALVTSSGSNRVAVVDIAKLIDLIQNASDYERQHVLPNHLGKPTEFVIAHIPTLDCPRGILIVPDGTSAFVANSLDDSLTVIDVATLQAVQRIDLGGPKQTTLTRYGERLFHSANITFHRQFSCHTCHPDGHVDGLTYDIQPDGIGVNPVDNRTLRGILDTAPFKWTGINPSLQRQCGPRLAAFFTRIQPFTSQELHALETYICTIPRPPNRNRALGAKLTDAQRRGKAIFQRTRTNDGRVIPENQRCVSCHFPPLYTDRTRHNVGTQSRLDTGSEFDVPHLTNIYDSAPYLHNGMAETLEEIWTRYNPNDQHGVTNDLTKDQLNDLIEYLKTL